MIRLVIIFLLPHSAPYLQRKLQNKWQFLIIYRVTCTVHSTFNVMLCRKYSPNLMTCLFIFLIVKCSISHKYILVNSLFISLEKIHVATAEHSTICVFNNLSMRTHIICWCECHNSNTLCNKHICASSESAMVWKYVEKKKNMSESKCTNYIRDVCDDHLFYLKTYLENFMEFCDGSKTMRETFRTQIQ